MFQILFKINNNDDYDDDDLVLFYMNNTVTFGCCGPFLEAAIYIKIQFGRDFDIWQSPDLHLLIIFHSPLPPFAFRPIILPQARTFIWTMLKMLSSC